MKTFLRDLAYLLLFILVVDVVGYIAWSISGQAPVDGMYIGAITNKIISIIK